MSTDRCSRCGGTSRLFVADPSHAADDDPYTCPECVSPSGLGTEDPRCDFCERRFIRIVRGVAVCEKHLASAPSTPLGAAAVIGADKDAVEAVLTASALTQHIAESRRQAFDEVEQRLLVLYKDVFAAYEIMAKEGDPPERMVRTLRFIDGLITALDAVSEVTGSTKDDHTTTLSVIEANNPQRFLTEWGYR